MVRKSRGLDRGRSLMGLKRETHTMGLEVLIDRSHSANSLLRRAILRRETGGTILIRRDS